MSFLRRIGQKIVNVAKVGAKIATNAGRVGGKYAGLIGRAMDSVSRVPMLSPITGHPAFQGMRGVVAGVARFAPKVAQAGMVVEGSAKRAERELGLRNNPVGQMASGGKQTTTLFQQRHGQTPSFQNRTSTGATGRQSLGEASSMFG